MFGSTIGRKSGAFEGRVAPWQFIQEILPGGQLVVQLIMLSTSSNPVDLQYGEGKGVAVWAELLGVEMAMKTVITVNVFERILFIS